MAGTGQKGGKNRKYGRNLKSKSAIAYKAERRDLKNKAKKALRYAKSVAKKAAKALTMVAHGTARRLRRVQQGITK